MALHNSAIGKHPKIAVKVISLPLTFSLCSLPFCFNWYFSLSPKRVQNKIDTTKRNTKHKRNERNVLNRDIHLVFSFRYSNSPFVIVLFTRLCVINFSFSLQFRDWDKLTSFATFHASDVFIVGGLSAQGPFFKVRYDLSFIPMPSTIIKEL